jgi:putative hydrolase of the HAD superfamily
VTFDLWQTLLLDNRQLGLTRAEARLEGTRRVLKSAGRVYDLEQIREAYWACFRQCREIRERHLDVSFQEQVEIFVGNIDPGLGSGLVECLDRESRELMNKITRVYADSFLEYPPPAHVDAVSALQGVKEMGLRIGLISNTGMTPGTTFRIYLRDTGMLSYFDALTFSDEVKLSKPGNEIFLITLRSLGASPAETVHVGDHIQNDVVGAKQCGLKTVWITGFSERADPGDPRTEPDESVNDLGEVVSAIARLAAPELPAEQQARIPGLRGKS